LVKTGIELPKRMYNFRPELYLEFTVILPAGDNKATKMIIQDLKILLVRDLKKLRSEIMQYSNESAIWRTDKAIPNSAGNLCLHLVGNLNTYIGAVLGNSGYIRQRDLEFSLKDIPVDELVSRVDETVRVIESTLNQLEEHQLAGLYPLVVFDKEMTTGHFLIHLAMHLGYHLGQVNYHRRLLDN
jgi:uncharacterized damage-inducible protein DinB